jgi:hypothetical protein
MITEEEIEDIQLTIPAFSVDVEFKTVPKPLENKSFFTLFLGPPRSGKSSLSTSLLVTEHPRKIYSGVFNHVFYIVPQASFNSFKDNPYKALSPDKIKHEFNADVLSEIVQRCEFYSKKNQHTLIIIDDFMSELKNVALRKGLERLIANRRHLRVSLFVISQTYRAIPLSTRKMLSSVFVFRQNNLKEIESIREELVPRDKNEFMSIYNHVFPPSSDPHNFMYIDVSNGEIYNKFKKISIKS